MATGLPLVGAGSEPFSVDDVTHSSPHIQSMVLTPVLTRGTALFVCDFLVGWLVTADLFEPAFI